MMSDEGLNGELHSCDDLREQIQETVASANNRNDGSESNIQTSNTNKCQSFQDSRDSAVHGTTDSAAPVNPFSRLSKWAARLFDPTRPKGLVQVPQTIPLNDEFLQAFGRREKETPRGMALDIDTSIPDADDDETDDNIPIEPTGTAPTPTPTNSSRNRKVKITNVKYTTTATTLEEECAVYGPVEYTNLLMQTESDNDGMNSGLAYVTFANAASAQACVEGLKYIDHRPVNVSLAAAVSSSKGMGGGGNSNMKASRYFGNTALTNLATKCFRCGAVGHVAANCTNEAIRKPCPLCASTDHEMRFCPVRNVCFTCGIPGHVSRDCHLPRGSLPQRKICTVCYETFTHEKWECRARTRGFVVPPPDVEKAVCSTCGRTGHYMCREMVWHSSMNSISCSNCGMSGHIGPHCNRPNLEACSRSEEVVAREIERASAVSSVEDSIYEANRSQNQTSSRQDRNHHQPMNGRLNRGGSGGLQERGRQPSRNEYQQQPQFRPFKSMPPPQNRWERNAAVQPNSATSHVHSNKSNSRNSYQREQPPNKRRRGN